MRNKKILLLVFTTIVTLVLAVVAVITSLKLKEMATIPVTPNVPSSKPKAAEVDTYACQTSFTVTSTLIACQGACTLSSQCAAGLTCSESKCVNPSCAAETDCVCPSSSPTPTPTPTATPEPAKCNIECNPNSGDTGCSDGYTCEPNSRRCRNSRCSDREDCTCKVDTCNKECNPNVQVQDTGCTDGLKCEPNSRRCRNAACDRSESCTCPSPTPIPSTVPKAGNTAPTVLFIGVGALLVVLGVLAAGSL